MIILPGYVKTIKDEKLRKALLDNLMHGGNYELGICEQLRFVFDSVYQLPEGEIKTVIIDQLIDALGMAKKMGSRLRIYHEKYNDTTGHAGTNIVKTEHTHIRRKIRSKRIL